MTESLLQTPLYDWHAAAGGRIVDFGGWAMPVQYTTIVAEHRACRQAAALFDVSHMGRFRFDGPGAAALLDRLCTRRVGDMPAGRIRYSLITNPAGGILDDVLVYRFEDEDGDSYFSMVVNAGNREKIAAWIERHREGGDVEFCDRTRDTAMIAVQGPQAPAVAGELLDIDPCALKYYRGVHGQAAGRPAMISRTGYTGEDGCEITLAAEDAQPLWEQLLAAGAGQGVQAAGLGARDTLRLEAAMPLYGHELSEQIDPYQAGLGFAVQLEGREFIGAGALRRLSQEATRLVRVGLETSGRRVPREGCTVCTGEREIGRVTSGTFSPTLEKSIGMAYIEQEQSAVGTAVEVDIRGRREPAVVVKLPFYRRA